MLLSRGFTFVLLAALAPAQTPAGMLRGVVKDPSGSVIPSALISARGPRGDQSVATNERGEYSFIGLPLGRYRIRVTAQGFAPSERNNIDVSASSVLNFDLAIEANTQGIDVNEGTSRVSVDPDNNGDATILGQKQLEALADDPDLLEQQLLALAGGGPNGGQIYVDGFSGARLPPKASIQEIRINANPYSPENDQPGGSVIQVITKPGTSIFHGQVYGIYNKEALNSRSPLLAQQKRTPFKFEEAGFTVSGAIKKDKSSFTLNLYRENSIENSFVNATTLDANLASVRVSEAVAAPRTQYAFNPRIDYLIDAKNSLSTRYSLFHLDRANTGVGDFSLASRGYTAGTDQQTLQLIETSTLTSRLVLDTRLQFGHNRIFNNGDNRTPSISVQGAFSGGGSQIGQSGRTSDDLEIGNSISYGRGRHTYRIGGRFRNSIWDDTSANNFGGSYTFQGGSGPALDGLNQAIPGTRVDLTALEVYRRTLLFQRAGLSDAQVRALGGGAYQFTLSAGQGTSRVTLFDAAVYVADDWRARPNLTVSYGLRYENQTNIGDHTNFGPRVAMAWNVGKPSSSATSSKTVVRAAAGVFYGRVGQAVTLNAERFDGATQQSFVILNPSFFPTIPSIATLAAGKSPQQMQYVDDAMQTQHTYQMTAAVDRQINEAIRLSVTYTDGRGVHLPRSRNINAPLNGVFPYGDRQVRMLTESTGFLRQQTLTVTPSINYKGIFVVANAAFSRGQNDTEGQPADPYNLRAEWGPSSSALRFRSSGQLTFPTVKQIMLSVMFQFSSAPPYNITVGRDLNGDSIISERPGLRPNIGAVDCHGASLAYKPTFGCFDLNPAAGTAISRNSGRGVALANMQMVQLRRSWILGKHEKKTGPEELVTSGGGGGTTIRMPASMRGGPGSGNTREYVLEMAIIAQNPLNHPTYTVPSGDLSSPFFGVYRTTSNGASYNRRVDLQLVLRF